MNSAKKAFKNQNNPVRVGDTGDNKKNPVVLIVVIALVSLFLIGGVAYENLKPEYAVTIDGKKISVNKMMYNIWNVENQYNYMDQMYQMYYNTSYWEMTADSETGATYADQAKDEVMNAEVSLTILYDEAIKAGYELTDDEKKEVQDDVKTIKERYSFWNRLRLGFTDSYLEKQLGKTKLVARYREDIIDGLDVDDETITAEINKDDYKEYEIGYYYVATTVSDEDGNSTRMGKKEIEALTEEMETFHKAAADAEDFSTLIGEDDDTTIDYGSTSFIEKDGWSFASEKNLKKIKAMAVDEISDVIVDDESGYIYFVKMVDNTSTESYDSAVDEAISDAEDEAFDEYYDEVYAKHKVSINEKVWGSVTLGNITTSIPQEETKEEESTSESSEETTDEEDSDASEEENGDAESGDDSEAEK